MAGASDLNARFEAARALLRTNRPADALQGFDELLRRAPSHLPTLVSRGSALLALGRLDEAEANWRATLARFPGHDVVLWNLGMLLIERERHAEALALADEALAVAPTQGRALLLRGDALSGLARFEEAVAAFQRLPRTGDTAPDALTKEALAQAGLQRYDVALALLDEAIALRPDNPFASFRRAIVRLAVRDFGGWDDYEARWRLPFFQSRSGGVVTPDLVPRLTLKPTLDDLAGQRVLLLGEQGIGDQVMFASVIPELGAVAKAVTCVCDERLVGLFAASFPGVSFAGPRQARVALSSIDRLVAMGSLGSPFRPTEAAFPGEPYLAPRPEARARWAERLGPRSRRLRIGISWRGGLPTTRRTTRSLDWARLAPILQLPGSEFVSLQYGDVTAELAAAPVPIRAFAGDQIDDFEELAALTAELDAVVSVQTALVHLCGAIGQDCLTLVPHNPEWRYTAAGSTMPWYRSVRLFRQAEPGNWAPVVAQAADALRARLGASS
jgi:tetratricopeptide (TPR) repeat protein